MGHADEHPRLVILTLALIVVSGIAGFTTRASREDPESRVRWGYVTTELPGAQPHEVESLLSEPIEQAVREAGTVRSIESSSLRGVSLVFIRLTDEVTDVDQSWLKIQDKLSQIADKLPKQASTPILVDELRWGSHTRVIGLHERGDSPVPTGVLSPWAKELNNRLSFVPGTRFTEVIGLPREEVSVEINEETIAATNLTAREIVDRIQARDSGGLDALLQSGDHAMPITLSGDIDNLDDIRNLLVLSGTGNRQVRLGDLATIRRLEQQPRNESAFLSGRRAVIVATRMDDSYGIDTWTEQQREVLDDFNSQLPAQLGLTVVFNQKKYTDDRAASLYESLGMGILFVVASVCLMMGWRAAIPICAALPLTLGIVFFLMIPFGIALHQMSIAGLILALGMLVDNPIIMVDDIQRRLNLGIGAVDAYRQSISHLKGPLLGSNITTILGFTPILLIGGPTGEFMEQLGWSVIACLVGSLVLSLSIIPILAIWCLKPNRPTTKLLRPSTARDSPRLVVAQIYMKLLGFGLRVPLLLIGLTIALAGFGFFVARSLPEQFFPTAERDHFHFSVRLPTHVSIAETERVAERARQIIMRHAAVEVVTIVVGRSAPKLHYSMVALEDNRPNYAQGLVQLNTAAVPLELIHTIQAKLDQEIPEAQCIVTLIEQGPPAPAPIELRIYGPSLQQLVEAGQQAQALLMQVPGVIHTHSSLDLGGPVLALDVSQTDAEQAGLDDATVARQIHDSIDGLVVTTMSEEIEEIPIRVRLANAAKSSPDRVLSLPLVTGGPNHQITPVDSLAKWSIDQQFFSIYRRDALRCNIVYAYTRAGSLPIQIEDKIKDTLKQAAYELPLGYHYDFGGISLERNSAVGNLFAYTFIVCVLIFSTLVLTFGSFRLALIVVAVATLSVGLGLTSLWLFSYPIGIVSIIGIAGLLGLAVNDSIVVLNECQVGEGHSQSIQDSVFVATRHVLTTSVTTVVGVLPLIYRGGPFWPPMMIVIAGGIVGATLIALGFTPACYSLFRNAKATTSVS